MNEFDPKGCCEIVGVDMRGGVQCPHPPTIKRRGRWYCAEHDPVAIDARCDAAVKEWARIYERK